MSGGNETSCLPKELKVLPKFREIDLVLSFETPIFRRDSNGAGHGLQEVNDSSYAKFSLYTTGTGTATQRRLTGAAVLPHNLGVWNTT